MTKKVKLNKAILGKKNFNSRIELEYYRRYETMELDKKLVSDVHQAVGICEGYIPADTAEQEIEAWQYLIDTGVAWRLQGWFGRQAQFLIDNKICKEKVVN
jgi:hypothetical protein|tara:strand:- start:486 stop:788 length:303 start_codon:yes stop_codon:yes gene_type:complete